MPPPAKLQPVDLKKLFIQNGLSPTAIIISGELISDGKVQWDIDKEADFLAPPDEKRMKSMLTTAAYLKEEYAKPEYARLTPVAIEREKVDALMQAMERNFRNYNPRVSAELAWEDAVDRGDKEARKEASRRLKPLQGKFSTHDDWERRNTPKPAHISEFDMDETVCRHRAAIMSQACTKAGIENCYAHGYVTHGEKDRNAGPHAWIVSRTTGNVIEACASPSYAYKENVSKTSIIDMAAGYSTITVDAAKQYACYGSGNMGKTADEILISNRRAILNGIVPGDASNMLLPIPNTKKLAAYDGQKIAEFKKEQQELLAQQIKIQEELVAQQKELAAQQKEKNRQNYMDALERKDMAAILMHLPNVGPETQRRINSEGDHALDIAVKENNIEAAQQLPPLLFDIHKSLKLAIKNEQLDIVRMLAGPQYSYRFHMNEEMYMAALKAKDPEILEALDWFRRGDCITIATDLLEKYTQPGSCDPEKLALLLENSRPFPGWRLSERTRAITDHIHEGNEEGNIAAMNLLVQHGGHPQAEYKAYQMSRVGRFGYDNPVAKNLGDETFEFAGLLEKSGRTEPENGIRKVEPGYRIINGAILFDKHYKAAVHAAEPEKDLNHFLQQELDDLRAKMKKLREQITPAEPDKKPSENTDVSQTQQYQRDLKRAALQYHDPKYQPTTPEPQKLQVPSVANAKTLGKSPSNDVGSLGIV